MTEVATRSLEEIAAEIGQKLYRAFKDVSGQTKRETQKAEAERVIAEQEQAQTDMRQGLFTMTRCFHTADKEGVNKEENFEEFARGAFLYHRGWNKTANSMQRNVQTYIGMGVDIARKLLENGAIEEADYSEVSDAASSIYSSYTSPSRKKIYNYEDPGSLADAVEERKTMRKSLFEPEPAP